MSGHDLPRGGINRRGFLKGSVLLGTGVALGGLHLGTAGSAQALAEPAIDSVNDWGAVSPRGPITVLDQRPDKILVHHTAGSNSTDYSKSHAHAVARQIQQGHIAQGWSDSGQHFTISRGGYAMQGRHNSLGALSSGTKSVVGAHCPGQNSIAVGIENEGTYTSVEPPTALYDKLVLLCAYICDQYDIHSDRIYGHRDYFATVCPGDKLYAMLPKLRDDVHNLRMSD